MNEREIAITDRLAANGLSWPMKEPIKHGTWNDWLVSDLLKWLLAVSPEKREHWRFRFEPDQIVQYEDGAKE